MYSWGSDYFGCLGFDGSEEDDVLTPCLLKCFSSSPVDQVSCGDAHVVVLTKDSKVFSWGCGEFGKEIGI